MGGLFRGGLKYFLVVDHIPFEIVLLLLVLKMQATGFPLKDIRFSVS